MDTSKILDLPEYRFLKTDEHLGSRIILLGLGGSYSYGTNWEGSDLDVRGICLNRKSDLIGLTEYEQYTDRDTDTTIYTLRKIITLLANCNPNTIELLGLKPEHYLYLHPLGRELLDKKSMFLSRRAVHSFGGYADAQLRRLQNALARDHFPQREKEEHILRSMRNAMLHFNEAFHDFEGGSMQIYTGEAENPELESEVFLDVDLKHYPVRDYKNMLEELQSIIRDYDNLNKRNRKKDDAHLNKHAMHLVRLFLMGLDILEKGEINTFRDKEHDLLMSIRRGDFRSPDGCFSSEFYEMVSDLEHRFAYAAENTGLPAEPDTEQIQEYLMKAHETVILEDR